MVRRYAGTRIKSIRNPTRFAEVGTLFLFLGHVKSGGSLIGSLLDAHPDALVSDEADVMRYVEAGFERNQIFHIIEKGSRREAMKGRVTARRLEPYSLAVPGLYQGRSDRVRALGDARAGPTTRRLGGDLDQLSEIDRVFSPVVCRFIHVVRNPYDPISAMVRRGRRTFSNAITDYEEQCRRLLRLRDTLPPDRIITVRYENFTSDPVSGLEKVCVFVGLPADPFYLEQCASIVDPCRPGERTTVDWDRDSIESVERLIDSVPFLEGYEWG
jgi:hypothetical protein